MRTHRFCAASAERFSAMKKILLVFLLSASMFALFGCSQESLADRVSEYRSKIYLAESDGASLQAEYSEREYPYAADGIVSDKSKYFEVRAALPDNTLTYNIAFSLGGREYGGEMSYDSVRKEFTFSQSLSEPEEDSLTFTITAEDGPVYTLEAARVGGTHLSLPALLDEIENSQKDVLQDFAGEKFNGEIYVRLLSQDGKCYYYVGFIDRSGKCLSFLADAETGNVLATRQP